ncbi:MAG: TonB-dependent receptor [Steroidobacteraceae bacterium]
MKTLLMNASAIALTTCWGGLGQAAWAQTAPQGAAQQPSKGASATDNRAESASASTVDEILVTAQKRSERLQDVPVAVTVVTSEQLTDEQVNDTYALVKSVPALTFQQGNNPANSSLRIRGVGTTTFGQGVEPAVSVVIDGVVAARQMQGLSDLADIERIEVLRGPQGTLFGKNATAGVLNVVTAAPTASFYASSEVTVAQHDEYRVKGTVSGPLSETFRARLSAYYNDVGGHEYNVTTGSDYGGNKGHGVRGKLAWNPTDVLDLTLSVDHGRTEADCCRRLIIATNNPDLAALYAPVVPSPKNRSVADNARSGFVDEQQIYSLQGNLDLGAVTATSITAYQVFKNAAYQDIDGLNTPTPIYVGGNSGAFFGQFDMNDAKTDLKNFTQELRVASNASDAVDYVAGVFYSNLDLRRTVEQRRAYCTTGVLGQPCAPATVSNQSQGVFGDLTNTNMAAFGQVGMKIAGGLKIIGGLRIQRETLKLVGNRIAPLVSGDIALGGTAPNSGTSRTSDSAISGKAGLQYEFSRNAQTYASYTRGYKGQGFETDIGANFISQEPIRPENVNAYEIGFKGQTSGGALRFGAALFLADYTDLQIQANRSDPTNGTLVFETTNAGSARTQGIELEATARPTQQFSVSGSVSYTDAHMNVDGLNCPIQSRGAAPTLTSDFPVNTCFRSRLPNTAGVLVTSDPMQNIRNGDLVASPKWRIMVAPRVDLPISSGLALFTQARLSYISEQQYTVEQDPLTVQGSYTLLDASVGIRSINSGFTLTFYAKNLLNQNYFSTLSRSQFMNTPTARNAFDQYATFNKDSRRYFGATAAFKFQ